MRKSAEDDQARGVREVFVVPRRWGGKGGRWQNRAGDRGPQRREYCGARGQIFIYLTISLHDCLMLSVFTTSRKCLSVVLSSIIFKHSFSNAQWLGASMVLGGTILEVYTKHQSKTKTHEAKKHEKVDKEK